jgi:hypothetical protein
MSAEILVAIITSVGTLLGVIITVRNGNSKTLYRIEQLERKQDKHNTLIERMYKAEDRLDVLDEKVKVSNHRIDDLEHGKN